MTAATTAITTAIVRAQARPVFTLNGSELIGIGMSTQKTRTAPHIEPALLTVEEVGYLLRLGRTKAYDLVVKQNRIPSAMIDGSRRVRRVDVERYLDQLFDKDN